jgi:hypothetical protein
VAKSVAQKKYYTFVGGLNTEAGPLTYPPNVWQEGVNVVPNIDGSLSKRKAVNYERDYELSTVENTATQEQTGAFACEEWNVVAGNGNRNFIVQQRRGTLFFYDNTAASISASIKAFSIALSTYQVSGNPNTLGSSIVSCTSANGCLIVSGGDIEPILVTYNPTTDTISHAPLLIKIRDLYGIDDELDVDETSPTISAEHQYNLYNQGWNPTTIGAYFAATGNVPSNAQTWISAKDSDDNFDPALLDKQDFGSTPAAKGRYILDLFNRDRATISSTPGIPAEVEYYRPTTCAFYAGRAWYAGINSATLNSWVLFSQVADTTDKYGKCYQEADPTSEFISDLVDTDGGVIPIQDAGTILKLVPFNNSVVVFADNGVWLIAGGGITNGFGATSYEVRKITSIGAINARCIVEADQALYYWSTDGIWTLRVNDAGVFSAKNISETTIQTEYQNIPVYGRLYAAGRYHPESKTIYWIYNDDSEQDGVTTRFKKNSMLCLDIRLGAFYTLSVGELATNSPYIVDAFVTKQRASSDTVFSVVVGNDQVEIATGDVVSSMSNPSADTTEMRFMTMVPVSSTVTFKTTFSRFEDGVVAAANFKDWYDVDDTGVGYPCYVITGDDLGANQGGDKKVQALYLVAFFGRTETGVDGDGNAINPSSCMLQVRWDWTDLTGAGKWSTERQIYRHNRLWFPTVPAASFNDGYPVVVTKNKVRGRGRSVVFKFTADEDMDMQLYGWATTFIGNSNV